MGTSDLDPLSVGDVCPSSGLLGSGLCLSISPSLSLPLPLLVSVLMRRCGSESGGMSDRGESSMDRVESSIARAASGRRDFDCGDVRDSELLLGRSDVRCGWFWIILGLELVVEGGLPEVELGGGLATGGAPYLSAKYEALLEEEGVLLPASERPYAAYLAKSAVEGVLDPSALP